MRVRKAAIVLNGFIHDFTTGYWLAAMIAIRLLAGFRDEYPALAHQLGSIQRFFFWNTVGAAVVIFATGAGRTLTYVDNVFGESTEQTRRRMLIAKHVILIAIFGAGGWWAYQTSFR
jgi:uncharacterized membrane protein